MTNIKAMMAEMFRRILTRISPKLNTAITYRIKFKRKWDENNPITLDDKILWLKFHTYWENPLVKKCADKFRVREYLQDMGYEHLLVDLYGVYEKVDEIPWAQLPRQYVLKLNTGCGCNIIVFDKNKLDIEKAKLRLDNGMKEKYYLSYSEMQYKDVKPYILCEKYIGEPDGTAPLDYKFYCMNGQAKYVMICTDRVNGKHAKYFYFNREWEMQPFTYDSLEFPDIKIPKPEGIEEAFRVAEDLSKPFPFVRVDLYIIQGKIYFGELTFTPSGGLDNGRMYSTDKLLGDELILPSR